jgi:hypothetical protein
MTCEKISLPVCTDPPVKGNSVLLSHVISRDPDVALHEGETEFLAGMPAFFV